MELETVTVPVGTRSEWLERRRQDVTASEIAAVFGLHPYKTPLQLWADKTGVGLEVEENAAMRRGRWLEDAVINACKDNHPDWDIQKPGIYVRAPSIRLGATPDAIANGTINVQCKTVAASTFKSWDGSAPTHYQLQALTEGLLLNAERSILAVLVTSAFGAEYHEYEIPRHPAAEAKIVDAVPQFWKKIEAGEAPRAEYGEDTELLGKLYAPDDGLPLLDLSADNYIGALLEERARLSDEKKSIEDRIDQIKGEVLEKLAGHTTAMLPGWKISNKVQSRKETIIKATSFPVLRISRLTEKEQAA
jgi:putative phage-type endonuclease